MQLILLYYKTLSKQQVVNSPGDETADAATFGDVVVVAVVVAEGDVDAKAAEAAAA